MQYIPSHPSVDQRNQYQPQSVAYALTMSQAGQRGQSMGQGRGQGPHVGTLGIQGRIYAVVPPTGTADQ